MGLKSIAIKPFAGIIGKRIDRWKKTAVADQQKWMKKLVADAKNTQFGKDFGFDQIHDYESFKKQIPLVDYEDLKPYVERCIHGETDILWPGKSRYFAKTSGTTSGVKYIPISNESISNHIHGARAAIMNYMAKTGDSSIFDGRMIFLSGSPELDEKGGVPTGRLSGIVNHEVPGWIRGNQLPSYQTNCIEDWETKLEKIIDETLGEDMRLISGIPPWVQMYFERILERTGKKTVLEVFPNFSLFIYGGVNFEPYRAKLEELVGKRIHSVELYPASEGFFAFQDDQSDKGMLLNTDSGIFYEFVPADEYFSEQPSRLKLDQVETNKDYALIVNNNAGLWGYSIGDLVRFTSLKPYKVIVSGRIKHFISAFGEHVIGKEVEEAMNLVSARHGVSTIEFTVAPQVNPESGLPYHEWLIEFANPPADMVAFAADLDVEMTKQNIYYEDLITGSILRPLVITPLGSGAFRNYMKSEGKLGGQNKVPRLSNDRKIADALHLFLKEA